MIAMQVQSKPSSNEHDNRINIMLVDDEPDILTVFKKSIELAGYSTYGFVNPLAALEHFKQNSRNYQVVLTDVRMPGMSGFELSRQLRSISPDVKIILMTSFEITFDELHKVMPSLQIDGLIEKPVKVEKLRMIIKAMAK